MTKFVALDQNCRLIDVENAHRGMACNSIYASCGEPVMPEKG